MLSLAIFCGFRCLGVFALDIVLSVRTKQPECSNIVVTSSGSFLKNCPFDTLEPDWAVKFHAAEHRQEDCAE
eukprot:9020081-Pyramimonas_sp.AAC.1